MSIEGFNKDCDAARAAFAAKNPFGLSVGMKKSGADILADSVAQFNHWADESGYHRYMRLFMRLMRAKHGFVRCDNATGWRLAE